jgi:polyisoprenoid-binding protein YceI
MKLFKTLLLLSLVVVLIINIALIQNGYTLTNDHTVTIHGTSNLHAWDENVQVVSGDGNVNWNKDGSFDLNAVNIKMNVHSIKSDMGAVMNNNTYKALKADTYPEIIFKLTVPIKSVQAKPNQNSISAKGTLTIAGVTKAVDMQVKVFMQEQNKLTFEGSQSINMTDFGINPPTALFGTLKTGNEITIYFKTNFTTN